MSCFKRKIPDSSVVLGPCDAEEIGENCVIITDPSLLKTLKDASAEGKIALGKDSHADKGCIAIGAGARATNCRQKE